MNSDSCMCVNPTPRVGNQRECELCEKPILPPPISPLGPNGERLEFIGKGVPRKGDWYMPTWGEYKPVKATGDWGAGVERELLREISSAVPASGERPAPVEARLKSVCERLSGEELLRKMLWRVPILTLDHDGEAEVLQDFFRTWSHLIQSFRD